MRVTNKVQYATLPHFSDIIGQSEIKKIIGKGNV